MITLDDLLSEQKRRLATPVTKPTQEPVVEQTPLVKQTASAAPTARPLTVRDLELEKAKRERGLTMTTAHGGLKGAVEFSGTMSKGVQALGVKAQDTRPDKLTVNEGDYFAPPISGIPSKTDEITEAVKRGVKQTYVAPLGRALESVGKTGQHISDTIIESSPEWGLPAYMEGRGVLESITSDDLSIHDKAKAFLYGTARMTPQVAGTALLGVGGYAVGGPGGAAIGAGIGLGGNFLAETGDAYESILTDNPKVDKQEAASRALMHGTIATALESLPVANVLRFIPGATKVIKETAFKELLKSPKVWKSVIGGMVTQGISESTQESLQEISLNIARKAFNENQDIFENVSESAFMGAVLGVITGGLGGGVGYQKAKKQFKELGLDELAQELKGKSPQVYRATLIAQAKQKIRDKNYTDEELDAMAASPADLAKWQLTPTDIQSIKVERNFDKSMQSHIREAIDAAPDEATKLGILSTLQGSLLQKSEEQEALKAEEAKVEAEEKAAKQKAKEEKEADPTKLIKRYERELSNLMGIQHGAKTRKERLEIQKEIDAKQELIKETKKALEPVDLTDKVITGYDEESTKKIGELKARQISLLDEQATLTDEKEIARNKAELIGVKAELKETREKAKVSSTPLPAKGEAVTEEQLKGEKVTVSDEELAAAEAEFKAQETQVPEKVEEKKVEEKPYQSTSEPEPIVTKPKKVPGKITQEYKEGQPIKVFRGLTQDVDPLQPREGYITTFTNNPHVARSYAGNEGHVKEVDITPDKIIEFPVNKSTVAEGNEFDKIAFDKAAKNLKPGEMLIARDVYDTGPRADLKTDPDKYYSYSSDIIAYKAPKAEATTETSTVELPDTDASKKLVQIFESKGFEDLSGSDKNLLSRFHPTLKGKAITKESYNQARKDIGIETSPEIQKAKQELKETQDEITAKREEKKQVLAEDELNYQAGKQAYEMHKGDSAVLKAQLKAITNSKSKRAADQFEKGWKESRVTELETTLKGRTVTEPTPNALTIKERNALKEQRKKVKQALKRYKDVENLSPKRRANYEAKKAELDELNNQIAQGTPLTSAKVVQLKNELATLQSSAINLAPKTVKGLSTDQTTAQILKDLGLKKIPRVIKVWDAYKNLPEDVRQGLESGKAVTITPRIPKLPQWRSRLIDDFIMKAPAKQSTAEWIKTLNNWTKSTPKMKKGQPVLDKEGKQIMVEPAMPGPVVEDLQFSGLMEWLEDIEDPTVLREHIINFLKVNSFIGTFKEKVEGYDASKGPHSQAGVRARQRAERAIKDIVSNLEIEWQSDIMPDFADHLISRALTFEEPYMDDSTEEVVDDVMQNIPEPFNADVYRDMYPEDYDSRAKAVEEAFDMTREENEHEIHINVFSRIFEDVRNTVIEQLDPIRETFYREIQEAGGIDNIGGRFDTMILGGPSSKYRIHTLDYSGIRSRIWSIVQVFEYPGGTFETDVLSVPGMEDLESLESAQNNLRRLQKEQAPDAKGRYEIRTEIKVDTNEIYSGSHFRASEGGNLIHIRATVRENKNGEPVMFIEEIQSDWHQRAARSGMRTTTKRKAKEELKGARKIFNALLKEHLGNLDVITKDAMWDSLRLWAAEINNNDLAMPERYIQEDGAYNQDFTNAIRTTSEAVLNNIKVKVKREGKFVLHHMSLMKRVKKGVEDMARNAELMDNIVKDVLPSVFTELTTSNKFPMGPLRNNWELFALKKMVMQGVFEGTKYVAWPKTIEQVEEIEWSGNPNGRHYPAIVNRYVTRLGQLANKTFRKYGTNVQDIQIPTGHSSDVQVTEDWETVQGFEITNELKKVVEQGMPLPSAQERKVQGVYYDGVMHFVSENIDSTDEVKGLLVHEGGHYLRRNDPWFEKKYKDILGYFHALQNKGGPEAEAIKKAFRKVNRPDLPDAIQQEEALFYYLQDEANQKGTVWERLVDLFKRWLYKYFARTPKQLNLSGRAMASIILDDLKRNVAEAKVSDEITVDRALASEKTNEDAKEVNKAVSKEANKLLKKALGEPIDIDAFIKQEQFKDLSPAAKSTISLWKSILKRQVPGVVRDKDIQTTSTWTRLLSSPEYYFLRDETAAKVFRHAQEKGDARFIMEHQVMGDFVEVVENIKKTSPRDYTKANKYLIKADQSGIGFSIKWNTEERVWMILDHKNKPIYSTEDEQAAVKYMIHAEQQYLRKSYYSKNARTIIQSFRELTNRGFDLSIHDFRRQIWNAQENEQPIPKLAFVDNDGNKTEITLEEAITTMGDLRGTYFPRERPSGGYVLRATKKGSPSILFTYNAYMPENAMETKVSNNLKQVFNSIMPIGRKQAELESLGYEVQPVEMTSTPSNVIFDVPGLLTSLQALLDASDKKLKAEEMKEADKVILTEVSRQLALRIADVYKAKGTFSSRLKRAKDVWEGYEEDMLKAATGYAQRIAVGKATRDTARKMLLTMTGRDVSWSEFRKTNPGKNYTDYRNEVKRKAIDATKQLKLYEDLRLYISHVLRPDDSIDRVIGYAKAAAVFKFLGFRVASAAINQTNMALAVPATISGHADMSLTQAWKHTSVAAQKYTLYRLEKIKKLGGMTKALEKIMNAFASKETLTDYDRYVFDKISERGWDEAQFNHEAARVIADKLNKYVNGGMAAAMYLFGATEKANRAMTIFAGYYALRESKNTDIKKLNNKQKFKAAKKISDRAHGVYGSMAKPWLVQKWRPADLLYTFMKFQHNYLLNAIELGWGKGWAGWKRSAYMMFAPALMSGLEASAVLKFGFVLYGMLMGVEEPEEEFYQKVADEHGMDSWQSRFVRHGGVGAVAHVNLRGSLQMNQPIPTQIKEIGGAPGSLVEEAYTTWKHIRQREYWKAFEDMMPTAFGSASKGIREYTQGVTASNYSPVYYGAEQLRATPLDVAARFFSFNPSHISAAREKQWREDEVRRAYTKYRSEIKSQLVHYIQVESRDPVWWAEIQKSIVDYNDKVYTSDSKYKLPYITGAWLEQQMSSAFTPDVYERVRRN